MSAMLSISSRQLMSIFHFTTDQSDHSSGLNTGSMRGIACSGGGALPSGSFQTNSILFSSIVGQAFVRAFSGTVLAYGMPLHLPSLPQLHEWKRQTSESPLMSPSARSAPMCGHHAFRMLSLPLAP